MIILITVERVGRAVQEVAISPIKTMIKDKAPLVVEPKIVANAQLAKAAIAINRSLATDALTGKSSMASCKSEVLGRCVQHAGFETNSGRGDNITKVDLGFEAVGKGGQLLGSGGIINRVARIQGGEQNKKIDQENSVRPP